MNRRSFSSVPEKERENNEFTWWQLFVMALGPTMFLILGLIPWSSEHHKAGWMLGIIFICAFWWLTEIIPLGITALLPLFMMPWCSIQTGSVTASKYANWVIFRTSSMMFFINLLPGTTHDMKF